VLFRSYQAVSSYSDIVLQLQILYTYSTKYTVIQLFSRCTHCRGTFDAIQVFSTRKALSSHHRPNEGRISTNIGPIEVVQRSKMERKKRGITSFCRNDHQTNTRGEIPFPVAEDRTGANWSKNHIMTSIATKKAMKKGDYPVVEDHPKRYQLNFEVPKSNRSKIIAIQVWPQRYR